MDPKPQEPTNNINPDSTVANVDDRNAHDTSKPDEKKAHANFTTKQREWMLAALVAGRDHSEPMTSCLKTDTIDRAKVFLKRWKMHTTLTTTPSSNSLRSLWKTFFNPNKTIAKVRAGGRPRKVASSDTELDGEKRPKTKKRKVSQRKPKKPASSGPKDRPVTAGRKQKTDTS